MRISEIKGIGPKKEEMLNKKGILRVEDLLNYLPKKYINLSKGDSLSSDMANAEGQFICVVQNLPVTKKTGKYLITKVHVVVSKVHCYLVFFNQKYILQNVTVGEMLWVDASIKRKGSVIELYPKMVEILSDKKTLETIQPLYANIYKIKSQEIKGFVRNALQYMETIEFEVLPKEIRERFKLLNRIKAYQQIHFPTEKTRYVHAKNTLIFTELFLFQCGLQIIKKHLYEHKKGVSFVSSKQKEYLNSLPFQFTEAQKNAMEEINIDMGKSYRMHRLLQGDVGSGKTIIAFFVLL